MANPSGRKFTYSENYMTGPLRITFCNLAEPSSFQGGKETYNLRVLVKKDNLEELNALKKLLTSAAGGLKLKEMDKHPFLDRDGDLRDGDAPHMQQYEGYEGTLFFGMSSQDPIPCYLATEASLEENGSPVELTRREDIKRELYNGCYAQLSIVGAHWEQPSLKGGATQNTTFFCNGIFKVAEGKRMGGGGSVRVDPMQAFMAKLGRPISAGTPSLLGDDDAMPVKRGIPVSAKEMDADEMPVKRRGRPKKDEKEETTNGKAEIFEAPVSVKRSQPKSDIASLMDD